MEIARQTARDAFVALNGRTWAKLFGFRQERGSVKARRVEGGSNHKSSYNTNRPIIESMELSRATTMRPCQNTPGNTRPRKWIFLNGGPCLVTSGAGRAHVLSSFQKIRNLPSSCARLGFKFHPAWARTPDSVKGGTERRKYQNNTAT